MALEILFNVLYYRGCVLNNVHLHSNIAFGKLLPFGHI